MKKQKNLMSNFHRCHVKRGDQVIVLTGECRGKKGSIKKVATKFINGPKVKIEGVNLVKKKLKDKETKFKYVEVEEYIHASNVRKI